MSQPLHKEMQKQPQPEPATSARFAAGYLRPLVLSQFLGALADNALLLVAIALLQARGDAGWMAPALRFALYGAYVLLSPFAGALADAFSKTRVLQFTACIKLLGAALMLVHLHPLLAYGLIGIGAVAHGPAKYGVLPEVLPPAKLVAANAWLEGATVAALLLGVVLGSALLAAPDWRANHALMPGAMGLARAQGAAVAMQSLWVVTGVYAAAALVAFTLRRTPEAQTDALAHPVVLLRGFASDARCLWGDNQSRVALCTTSLFWAAAATLQFVVLQWAAESLGLTLAQAGLLQGVLGIGMVVGALAGASRIGLARAHKVLPLGLLVGAAVIALGWVHQLVPAVLLLLATGAIAAVLLIPMNALLQHRGAMLIKPGRTIAVQAFAENLGSVVLLGIYGGMLALQVPLMLVVAGMGLLIIGGVALT
jgi:LPLT family lysophospholipid transporter-like MFS transporter